MRPETPTDWKTVVEQIRSGDPVGQETLYRDLSSGARLFLQRRLGVQDVEDRVHDIFLIVMDAIQKGTLREPERLMGFVRTVLYRQMNAGISRAVLRRPPSVTGSGGPHQLLRLVDAHHWRS